MNGSGRSSLLIGCAGLAVLTLAPQQRPAFETTVARIRVDVIVTDESGKFVEGLGADDFLLFEDGVSQEILGVELVEVGAGAGRSMSSEASASATGAGARPAAGRAAPRPSDVAPAVAGAGEAAAAAGADATALVFLVDLPGMDWRNKFRFASAWEQLLANSDELGMARAVYMIDQVGRLHELAPLSFDAERLRAAAARVIAEPLVRQSQQEILVGGGVTGGPTAQSIQERARTRATLELLTQFCKALAARGSRTALVWITSEVQITEQGPGMALIAARSDGGIGGGEVRTGPPPGMTGASTFGPFMIDMAISRLQTELHRAANSANVSIYTLDPTPAYELQGIGFDVQTRTAGEALLFESPLVQFAFAGLRDALKSASAETGGKSFIHWIDPAEALTAIESDASRFYLLTYANPPPIGDGRYHEIRVDVKDRDVAVRERSGYTDYPSDELEDRLLSGALNLPGTVGGPPLAARVMRKWSAAGDPILQIAVAKPQGLAADAPEFELHGLAVRGDGRIESRLEQLVRERPGGAGSQVYVHEWDLPAGAYDLHLVLRNPLHRELSATALPVEVLPATSEWATSDVVLVVPDAAGRPIPAIGDTIAEDQVVAAYVEVVFGRDPIVSGDLFNAAGTERIAELPPLAMQQSADGIFRGALRMTGIPTGDYALQVAVTDAAARQHRLFRIPFRVQPP